jgi:diacylglycerol kinase family enzyme
MVLIKPFPKLLAPVFIYRLFRGTMKDSKYVKYLKTDKTVILNSPEKRFHIDGEPVELSGNVSVTITKNALSVLKTKYNKLCI